MDKSRQRVSRWDKIVFMLGVVVKCYRELGLDSLTVLWIEALKEECSKNPVAGTLYDKISLLEVEEIGITELQFSYRNMLKFCTPGLREEIKSAIDTISLTGV